MPLTLPSVPQLPTPYYYYNLDLLRQTLRAIKNATADSPHFHLHYAVKANTNSRILSEIVQAGLGADCVSGGEVQACLDAGFSPRSIVFAGVGKTDKEILLGLEAGIACFNVESLAELEVINALAAQVGKVARIAFRINPNIDAHTHEKITTGLNENKFGIALTDTLAAIRTAEKMKNILFVGLHFHIGSQILNPAYFIPLCTRINDLQDTLEKAGIFLPSINVGGGLGIDYENPDLHPIPDFDSYFQVFKDHLHLRPSQEVHFELGRSIVGQCGSLIAQVLYMKQGHTKKFLILDAGFTELIRPAMYDALHIIENISNNSPATEVYDVVGPICESSDVFGKNISLAPSQRGDYIAIRSAGAYGEVMASTYNCRPLVKSAYSDTAK